MDKVTDPRNELKRGLFLEVLRSFGAARLAVTGTSMLPAIWPGDVLEVRRQGMDEVRRGDVVLFRRDGRLVVHRVVETLDSEGGNLLVTRGDRQRATDSPISNEEILGRVTKVLHGNRRKVPRLNFACRAGAWILSRSEFLTRVLVHLSNRPPWRPWAREAQWVS
jgi:Peptidase S24-like